MTNPARPFALAPGPDPDPVPHPLPRLRSGDDADRVRRDDLLQSVNRDVAELRRLMDRLFHWAAVIESSDDAIFGKTLDGIITSWNYGAERMYGYVAEEIVGRSVAILFPADRRNEFERIMERLREGERIDHFQTVRVRKDGETLDVSVTISPIRDLDGQLIGVASIGRDISAQKRLEERRLAFAAAASHELKTPITVQKMAVQSLRRAVERENTTAIPRLLERLEESLNRQARLVDGLLDLSRLERGTLATRPSRFCLDELVQDAVAQVHNLSHHALVVTAPVPVPVVADRDQVGEIVVNLLTNAIKYSPAADRVEIGVTAEADRATVVVRDFGIGVAKADQARIFEPFVRAGGAATTGRSGMGLGLYLAAQLADLQGGGLDVESAPDEGSTFSLWLPLPDEAGGCGG